MRSGGDRLFRFIGYFSISIFSRSRDLVLVVLIGGRVGDRGGVWVKGGKSTVFGGFLYIKWGSMGSIIE